MTASWRTPASRGLLSISSASAVGGLVGLAVTPLLSRLYAPHEFGVFASCLSLGTILCLVSTGRLETAIPIARDDEVPPLLRMAVTGSLTLSVSIPLAIWISAGEGDGNFGGVPYRLWWWVALTSFSMALWGVVTQILIRRRDYRSIAVRSIAQNAGTAAVQVVCAAGGSLGLLLGSVVARTGTSLGLMIRERATFRETGVGSRATLRRYWRFPIAFTPAVLLSSLAAQLPVLILASTHGLAAAGGLALAQRVVTTPASLLGAAAGQVYMGESSQAHREGSAQLRGRYLEASARLSLVAILVTMGAMLAPVIFPLALGPQWSESAKMAQAMGVFAGLSLLVSPLSQVFLIQQKGFMTLGVDAFRVSAVVLAAVAAQRAEAGPVGMVWALYTAGSVGYCLMWLTGLRAASSLNLASARSYGRNPSPIEPSTESETLDRARGID